MKKICILVLIISVCVTFFISFNKNKYITEFISKYGWIIDKKSVIIEKVRIPTQFDESINSYKEMLSKAGFNLDTYKGKTVTKYTYKLLNHIDKDAYINVFTYKRKIAFSDIIITRLDGYMHNINERKYKNAS
ncbi:MAG: DUF4830 domain-containing protein [Ruminococcaceae bacterium]|nr:DUF4830 domain-containing protein [Oscillospiraceae bacterium]